VTIQPRESGDAQARPEPGTPAQAAEAAMQDALSDAARQLVESATGAGRRQVWVLNGANLGRLGVREPSVYGRTTYAQLADRLIAVGDELGLDVDVRQTDDEATMIGWLHAAADQAIPVVLNPAAWSHYSIALRDAASQRTADLIEVHISNVHTREEFRHHSVISPVATGVIAGLGTTGYELALRYLAQRG
jgi:3-dehydroquinate dehydratase-2